MLTLYDAERCPYVGRVRIVLAEKQIPYESVWVDLGDKPAWLYEKNPAGRVPVVEEDGGLVLAESAVIMEYLDERFPSRPCFPQTPRSEHWRDCASGGTTTSRARTTPCGGMTKARTSNSTRPCARSTRSSRRSPI